MDILPTRVVRVADLDEPVRLHATGDWHLGERGCVESMLRRDIADIAADDCVRSGSVDECCPAGQRLRNDRQ